MKLAYNRCDLQVGFSVIPDYVMSCQNTEHIQQNKMPMTCTYHLAFDIKQFQYDVISLFFFFLMKDAP